MLFISAENKTWSSNAILSLIIYNSNPEILRMGNHVSECCLLRLPINQNELGHYHGNSTNYDASEVTYSPGCSDASRVSLPTKLQALLRSSSPVIIDSKMCLHFDSEHWLLRQTYIFGFYRKQKFGLMGCHRCWGKSPQLTYCTFFYPSQKQKKGAQVNRHPASSRISFSISQYY